MYEFFNIVGKSFWEFFAYYCADWRNLLVGGVVVVGVVIALMGVVKSLKPIKNIKNHTVKKIVLAWASVLLASVVTVVSSLINEFQANHFFGLCVVNAAMTIIMYWLYEYTALRDGIGWLVNLIVSKLIHRKPKTVAEMKKVSKEINAEVENLLFHSEVASVSQYKDDDLKNL